MESLLLHWQFALSTTFSLTPVQISASTRVSHGAAPSSSVSCPQVTLSAAHPQVQLDPTRTITSDLLSATLAEAATQLSFAAFLERCIFVHASRRPSYQSPPHLWMPLRRLFHTPLPLGTFPRNSRSWSPWLHLLRLTLSALHVLDHSARCFLMRLCRRLYTALQLMMPPHNYSSRSSSSGVSSPMTPLDRQASPSAHCNADSASPPQPHDIATLCITSSASHASDGHEDTTAPCVLRQPPPGLERYAHLCASHGIPVKAAPVRPRLCTSISVPLPQPHVSTTHVGTHPVRSATTYKRSASTALAGTHNPVGADPRAGTGPFPKRRALVLPMVKFGQSKHDGIGHIDTADSDLMHHQYTNKLLR